MSRCDAEFCAFIAAEAAAVFGLSSLINYTLLCAADVRPFLLGLQFFKGDLEFVVHPLEVSFLFVFRFGFVGVSGVWIDEEVWGLKV